jgi:hypothetical protein
LQFNQPVKLKSISIFSGVSPEQAPKTIQLFVNQPALDFSDAGNLTPTQEIVLTEKDVKGERVDLRFVKFQSVNSLYVSPMVLLDTWRHPDASSPVGNRSWSRTIKAMKRPHA